VSKLDFFTPKALHNLAQGITLGLSLFIHPSTLKALNTSLNNEIVKPFQGRDHRLTRFPACYAGLSYRTPSAYLMLRGVLTHSLYPSFHIFRALALRRIQSGTEMDEPLITI
jgi:hypothetical protein